MDRQQTVIWLASFLLSFSFSFYPKLADWYANIEKDKKQLIMVGLIFLSTILVYGASWLGIGSYFYLDNLPFDGKHIVEALITFIQAIVINAGTYKSTNYIANRYAESRNGVG